MARHISRSAFMLHAPQMTQTSQPAVQKHVQNPTSARNAGTICHCRGSQQSLLAQRKSSALAGGLL
jgi:hypothetical protein